MTGFYCSCCGEYHDHLPLNYGVPAPIYWSEELAKDKNSELGQDLCIIEGEHFFIKGNVEIPIRDFNEIFAYSIWVSLSSENFERAVKLWNDPKRVEEEPYFGWFSCQLPSYPDTLNLKTLVHTRELGVVPYIELEPTEHPLAIEQREGITMERVKEIAELNLHPDNTNVEKVRKDTNKTMSFWKRLLKRS
jgi:hypothetical protein